MRKKIAISANCAWNIVHYRSELLNALLKEGYEVYALAPRDGYENNIERSGCHYIPIRNLSPIGLSPIKDFKYLLELRKIFSENRIDLALQFTIKPNIYGSLAGNFVQTRTINTVTGLGYSYLNQGAANYFSQHLYKLAFRNCHFAVFQNPADLQLFVGKNLITRNKTVLIEGSGIDTESFVPDHSLNGASRTFQTLFVGRLLYEKGIREHMEAIDLISEKYPDAIHGIIGSCDAFNPSSLNFSDFKNWVNDRDNVWHEENVNDIKSYIRQADTVVLPSYREGLARIILESMSMEKPVITTDVPGCRDAIEHGLNGLIVQPKNGRSLADAISLMYNMPLEKRMAMGKNSRKIAKDRFDIQLINTQFVELVERALRS